MYIESGSVVFEGHYSVASGPLKRFKYKQTSSTNYGKDNFKMAHNVWIAYLILYMVFRVYA